MLLCNKVLFLSSYGDHENSIYFQYTCSKDSLYVYIYNILKIAELDCCQIIILSIYVPYTHAYTHVLRLSLYLPYEKR
jgi:hypothetical protein